MDPSTATLSVTCVPLFAIDALYTWGRKLFGPRGSVQSIVSRFELTCGAERAVADNANTIATTDDTKVWANITGRVVPREGWAMSCACGGPKSCF